MCCGQIFFGHAHPADLIGAVPGLLFFFGQLRSGEQRIAQAGEPFLEFGHFLLSGLDLSLCFGTLHELVSLGLLAGLKLG